jgi:hypothetical protein
MHLQRLDGDDSGRPVGAAVVRSLASGDIVLELGAADGPPVVRLTLSRSEAMRLIGATQDVLQSGGEEILMADD